MCTPSAAIRLPRPTKAVNRSNRMLKTPEPSMLEMPDRREAIGDIGYRRVERLGTGVN